MLVGKSYNKLDTQRRLTIPKAMRSQLGDMAMLTRGLDGGLFLFPAAYWQQIVNNLVQQPFTKRRARDFWRYLSNDAYEVSFDKIGRITLPDELAQFAQIQEQVVVIGSLQYAEIWDQTRYHEYFDQLAQNAEDIAEDLPWTSSPLEGTHAHTRHDR